MGAALEQKGGPICVKLSIQVFPEKFLSKYMRNINAKRALESSDQKWLQSSWPGPGPASSANALGHSNHSAAGSLDSKSGQSEFSFLSPERKHTWASWYLQRVKPTTKNGANKQTKHQTKGLPRWK